MKNKNAKNSPERICVFIGGKQIGVECLKILLKFHIVPQLVIVNLDDVGVDTWYDSVAKFARSNEINVIAQKKIKDAETIEIIKKVKPEIIFNIGGMSLIPEEVIDIPKLGVLNLHPALLPRYRGRYSTAHAIFNGEKYNGITLHFMDEGIDSGPIAMQEKVRIKDDDTAKSLYDRVFNREGKKLFEKFVKAWMAGKPIKVKPQDESKALYYPKGLPNGGVIDWSWDGAKIKRFIRAMTFEPYPPASFKIGDKEMVVLDKKYFVGFKEKA